MEREGVELLAGLDQLAVMGFTEIVGRLAFFRELERRITDVVWSTDLVPSPSTTRAFNMRIARAAHDAGRPVIYYIAPKVWASRPGRAKRLAAVTDHVAVIFPFEVEILEAAGATVDYVGNPLLDRPDDVVDAATFHETWGLDSDRPILAILPGSRKHEIELHLALFLQAADSVRQSRPDVQPVISRADALPPHLYEHVACPVVDDTRALLRHARAAARKVGDFDAGGRARGDPVSRRLPHGPALVGDREAHAPRAESVAPELGDGRGHRARGSSRTTRSPERLAELLVPLLDEASPAYKKQIAGLSKIESLLGTPGASERVAELGIELLRTRA